ncbi:MAG: [FeFe] hydrogenase H-cluster radical SAM maturase HydG [Victivallaceae bacterium]|nr:[FeFe] hydrogenase H-cluster radical SAM maturase HydG [Victivallaceae bacterium]
MTINPNLTAAEYTHTVIRPSEIDPYLDGDRDFIDDCAIRAELETPAAPGAGRVRDIIAKSLAMQTLSLAETAVLLRVDDPDLLAEMNAAALRVKKFVYDNRIVTFAPLYLSSLCVNNCLYCGFRQENKYEVRRRLTLAEIRRETEVLAGNIGHKRLIAVFGEHPASSTEYIAESLRTIYSVEAPTRCGVGAIRRVNVNAAPLPVEDLKILHEVGIGTFQVFQETYQRDLYAKIHPGNTVKSNYRWRLYCMHRAMEAGVDDVGIGALFGLGDWRFEVLGLVAHARELEAKFNVGPHTISFPRLEPACNAPLASGAGSGVSDADFLKLVTVLRLAVPYTGMIVTARESREIRNECVSRGCTQGDCDSRIGVGAYQEAGSEQEAAKQQFLLGDTRSLEEMVIDLAKKGIITSFCTAAYRCGRTGGCIMDLLKTGREGQFCKVNAVLTFREWLDDFASPETLEICRPVLEAEIAAIRDDFKPSFFKEFIAYYRRLENGERDLYF